jgi:hypothetical protein
MVLYQRKIGMKFEIFDEHVNALFDKCRAILKGKGIDYNAGTDRFHGFKDRAFKAGITKYQGWYILFSKGLGAIERYVLKGATESENIHVRIQDAINYLILLDAMITEDEQSSDTESAFLKQAELLNKAGSSAPVTLPLTPEALELLKNYVPPKHFTPFLFEVDTLVTKHGIECKVTSRRRTEAGNVYNLEATETGSIFQGIPESEIKPRGIVPSKP